MLLAPVCQAGGAECSGVWLAGPCHMMFVFATGGVVICVSHCVCCVCQGVYLVVCDVV